MGKYSEEVKRYIPVANAIAAMFGRLCEVTLHDLSSPQSSVVHTCNSHVTGSYIGQPVPHLLTQVLLSQQLKNDVVANYCTEVEGKRFVKSTTALLRNAQGEAIGALCIHMDTEPFTGIHHFFTEFLPHPRQPDSPVAQEPALEPQSGEEFDSVLVIVDRVIARTIPENDCREADKSTKLRWIKVLDEKGLFLIKGALEKVAAKLNISKVTLYGYLDEIRGPKETGE